MFDPMLLALRGKPWPAARLLVLPQQPLDPVCWIEAGNNYLQIWHPCLRQAVQVPVDPTVDEISFRRMVGNLQPPVRKIIAQAVEEIGVPENWYANYPDHARRIRAGDFGWLNPVEADDDLE